MVTTSVYYDSEKEKDSEKGSLQWFWVECYCLCRHVGQQKK